MHAMTDGGPENWNKTFFACLAYMVATGVCEEAYLTRLPVGHTENDCDQSMQIASVLSHGHELIHGAPTTDSSNKTPGKVRPEKSREVARFGVVNPYNLNDATNVCS